MQIRSIFLMSCVLISLCNHSFSQQSTKKERQTEAFEHINNLKKGLLLVKLYDEEKKVEAMERSGQGASYRARLRDQHDKIMTAVKEEYQFSEVAFYFTSGKRAHGFDSLTLYDSSRDTLSIDLSEKDYYILDSRYIYFKDMGVGQKGLSVLNSDEKQLDDPFPYYVRKRAALFFLRRDYKDMFDKLNEAFTEFYEEAQEFYEAKAE